MTYQEFKNKHNEEYIDYDGSYGCQCWDLIQYYNVEVLNVPDSVFSGCGWVGNMILWDWKFAELLEYFDEVDVHNMDQGDVCIWYDPSNEQNCHVAVMDNWDGYDCWYFSQNPNPCRVIQCNLNATMRAFRRKKETPPTPPEPTPVVTPNVPRDEYRDQIKIKKGVTELNVRIEPSINAQSIGKANPSTDECDNFYNYFETTENDGYTWYRISDSNWIAYSDEWEEVYPAKPKEEFVKLKVLEKKDGYVLVDLGQVWIKENDLTNE